MNIVDVIAVLQSSELANKTELVAGLNAAIQSEKDLQGERDRLRENNADLLTQKKNKDRELSKLHSLLEDLTTSAKIEGDDAEQKFARIKELTTAQAESVAKLQAAEDAKVAAETKMSALERKLHYQEAASKVGADFNALNRLVDLPPDRLAIDGDSVFVVGDDSKRTDLREYAKAQGEWFDRALFPTQSGESNGARSPEKPPSAPPSQSTSSESVVQKYLGAAGYGPRKRN